MYLILIGIQFIIIILILLMGYILGKKLLFLRENTAALIKEQTALLHRILKQRPHEKTAIVEEADIPLPEIPVADVFEPEEVPVFVPKADEATKTEVANVDTSTAEFDSGDVAKLKKSLRGKGK